MFVSEALFLIHALCEEEWHYRDGFTRLQLFISQGREVLPCK